MEQALSQAQHEQNRFEAELHRIRQEKNLMELEVAEKVDELEDVSLKLERVQSANTALHQQAQQVSARSLSAFNDARCSSDPSHTMLLDHNLSRPFL